MKTYQLNTWKSFHWMKNTRFYSLTLHQDLWGNWTVTRTWGRAGTKLGSMKSHQVSYTEGLQLLAKLAKMRSYRKYHEINTQAN